MDERTNADLHSEKDRDGWKRGKRKKGKNVLGLKRARENEQKHIREYGRADELPPGRFHRSRCYPRRMTVRAEGRAIRGKGKGVGGDLGGGYGGGKDVGRSALRKRITLCGPTKTNRTRGSDPLHPPRESPSLLTSSPVA